MLSYQPNPSRQVRSPERAHDRVCDVTYNMWERLLDDQPSSQIGALRAREGGAALRAAEARLAEREAERAVRVRFLRLKTATG